MASLLGDINDDGILSYTISATSGNFNVLLAKLAVSTDDAAGSRRVPAGSNGVPDGGLTLVLLGASVVGLYAFRRKH